MRVLALTGVPGTGKTTLARELSRSHEVRDAMDVARDVGAVGEYDEARDAHVVDETLLHERGRSALAGGPDVVIVEGHLAHFIEADVVVVLRCRPDELEERLRGRGYAQAKVEENVDAERLDSIAFEVDAPEAHELDTTGADPTELAAIVGRLAQGETVKHERLGGLGAFDHLEG